MNAIITPAMLHIDVCIGGIVTCLQGTGVSVPGCNRYNIAERDLRPCKSVDHTHRHWGGGTGGRTVTQLAKTIITPALHCTTYEQCTGVAFPGGDRCSVIDPAHRHRTNGIISYRTVA